MACIKGSAQVSQLHDAQLLCWAWANVRLIPLWGTLWFWVSEGTLSVFLMMFLAAKPGSIIELLWTLTAEQCSLKSCSKRLRTAAAHYSKRQRYKYTPPKKNNSSSLSRLTKLFAIMDKSCREKNEEEMGCITVSWHRNGIPGCNLCIVIVHEAFLGFDSDSLCSLWPLMYRMGC